LAEYGWPFSDGDGTVRSRILDCARGTGNTFVAFTKANFEVFGTDGSREMLNRAKDNCNKLGLSTSRLIDQPLNWTNLSLENDKFDNTPFDLIVNTANSFCHIPSTPEFMHQALLNFRKMLKPNGLLIIDTKKYIRERGSIAGVPTYKELQFDELENEGKIRTDRHDVGLHHQFGRINFGTRLYHDIDLSFSQRVGRTLIALTVSGEQIPSETFIVPYYPLPARQLQDQMEYAGFVGTTFPAREGPARDWKYDIVVGQKRRFY
jgi:SAM-dependent methyltransferase